VVRELADAAGGYVDTYNGPPESFAGSNRPGGRDGWLASFFFSYVVEKERPTDHAVVEKFKAVLKSAADKQIAILESNAYPVGTPASLRWWGSNLGQGQYAYPCLLYWALTKEQKYVDAASQLMDYAQGLNPIGKCYVTGIGSSRVHNPHDRESAYTKEMAGGRDQAFSWFGPGLRAPHVRSGRYGSFSRAAVYRQPAVHSVDRVHHLPKPLLSCCRLSCALAGRQMGSAGSLYRQTIGSS